MPPTVQWTQKEDSLLRELVEEHGTKAWAKIATLLGTKGSKQCRRRWKNFLNMSAKTCSWSAEEDAILIDAQRRLGNRWTEISRIFGDRTDNAVKNRWHALIKKNPALDPEFTGEGSDGAPTRAAKRRRTARGAAARSATTTENDSDLLDSARYASGLQYANSGGMSGGNTSGGVSTVALPTPFDQQASMAGNRMALHQQQAAAAAALHQHQQAQAQQQQQQQQHFLQRMQHNLLQQQQAQQQQAQLLQQQRTLSRQQTDHWAAAAAAAPAPLQIMVTKDFLTPWEQQLADEINAMNLPVHVEVAPVPLPPDASLLPDSMLPGGVELLQLGERKSWKQYVEMLDEPGDSRGLQELLDWFGSGNITLPPSGPATTQPEAGHPLGGRRMTRSLSKGSSGSGSLADGHRQLLVKLMSRGLEARSSSEEAMAAAVAATAAAVSGPTAPRIDPLKRTRSSHGSFGKRSAELERAAAAAVQQAGLAAAAAAGHTFGANGGLFPAPGAANGGGGGGRPRPSLLPSMSIPHIEPTPLAIGGRSDVLVTPSFSSHEIVMLLDALKKP
ncbi:hypothetical protein ABPG75_006640 [Micractinium tetrahymenae]